MIPTQTHYGGGKHIWDLTPHDNVARWGQAFVIAEIMYLFWCQGGDSLAISYIEK